MSTESDQAHVGQWLSRVAGPTLDDLGVDLRDWIRHKRAKNLEVVVAEAVRLSEGAEVHEIPTRTLTPLLNAASNEDDSELQHKWAALLANAATEATPVLPAFVDVLRQITPREARMLDVMYRLASQAEYHPESAEMPKALLRTNAHLENDDEYRLLAADLDRLQLIEERQWRVVARRSEERAEILEERAEQLVFRYSVVGLTPFGVNFIKACLPPERST